MNSKPRELAPLERYTNAKGMVFEYTIYDHLLGNKEHDYRLYTIQVKHELWGFRAFSVYVKKEEFAEAERAEYVAKTLALNVVKSRLEDASESGFPIIFAVPFEGWTLL